MKRLSCEGVGSVIAAMALIVGVLPTLSVAGLTNVSLEPTASVTADYASDGQPASNVIDGDYATQWATNSSPNHWLILDLGQSYLADSIRIVGVDTGRSSWLNYTVNYSLYTSSNDVDWDLVGSGTLYDNPTDWELRTDTWDLDGTWLQYVKVETAGGRHWPGFNELEVFTLSEDDSPSVPTVPVPASLGLVFTGLGLVRSMARRRSNH